ncbi:MAG: response regulator [Burkholderiales bacterium]
MNLPVLRSPGAIAFLDDDPDFLEMMALVVPGDLPISLFIRPTEWVAHLREQQTRREADNWRQQEIVDRWRKYRSPMIPQILRYWENETSRYGLVQVCVVDFSMPAMDGLQALRTLGDWPGMRVLLTGQADEQIAVDAFNDGLIQQFIAKQASDMTRRLIAALGRLQGMAGARSMHVWRSTLTPRQNALLNYQSIALELKALVDRQSWVEYVVLGSPFGILGRDANGHAGWLQLEPAGGLEELAELAEASVTSHGALEDIREGRQLINIELRQALGDSAAPEMREAFSIGNDEPLLGALFPIRPEYCNQSSNYQQFLGRLPARQVRS